MKQIESTINEEAIAVSVKDIDKMPHTSRKKSISALVIGLKTPQELEAVGKAISIPQLTDLLDTVLKEEKQQWKLSPILVGMPHQSFTQLLRKTSSAQLQLLQHEGVAEPMQHHLTLLSHKFQIHFDYILREIEIFQDSLNNIDPQKLSSEDVASLFQQVDSFVVGLRGLLDMTNKSLGIVWNTQRPDLINSISRIKNGCQKVLLEEMGRKGSSEKSATGLYAHVENKLFALLGNPNDPLQIDAIRDDEPVVEALAKFSIWYLFDYWKMGLLPEVKNRRELELHKEKLFAKVQKRLEKMGLATVKDMKKAHIFSKKTFEEWTVGQNWTETGGD